MAFWSSLRFSLRILRKHWKLTSIAVISLAIAMAAGAVGFSVFNTLLLRPPAVAAPAQLLTIYSAAPAEEFGGFCYDDYKYFRDNNQVFSGVMAFPYSISITPIISNGRSKDGLVNAVSDTFFSVLGVQPMLGRVFEKGDDDRTATLARMSAEMILADETESTGSMFVSVTRATRFSLVFGKAAASCLESVSRLAMTCVRVTPDLRRPTILSGRAVRSVRQSWPDPFRATSVESGNQTSGRS